MTLAPQQHAPYAAMDLDRGEHAAQCPCGFVGPYRETAAEANTDADRHARGSRFGRS